MLTLALSPVSASSAEEPRRTIGAGISAAGGLLVDPLGRIWVSDARKGFCRLAEPSGQTPGALEAVTCLGGDSGRPGPVLPGAAALLDPTPAVPGGGDEIALIPDAAPGSAHVVRVRWNPQSAVFAFVDTLRLYAGDLRPQAVTVGADASAYVVFSRARTITRVVGPSSPQPVVETVGFTAANGSQAIAAAGAEQSGRVVLYIAGPTGLVRYVPPTSGNAAAAPTTSFAVGVPARLAFDPATGSLYAGTAAAAVAGGDTVSRIVVATGRITPQWSSGYSRVGGIALRSGLVVVADDPGLLQTPPQTAAGAVFLVGELLPAITAGPTAADGSPAADPAYTNDPTPSFRVEVDGSDDLECAFDGTWSSCAEGDVTSPTPLGDGAHRFGVRIGAEGTVVERLFTVDTVAPTAPVVSAPAEGATVGREVVLIATAEAGATLRCAIDEPASAGGVVCASGQTLTFAAEGTHTIRVAATDRAGNVGAPTAVRVVADLTAPVPVIIAPAVDGASFTGTATFAFDAGGEAAATFRCRIDGSAYAACVSPASFTDLAAGAHTFIVEASDAVGNAATASRAFTFAVPRPEPSGKPHDFNADTFNDVLARDGAGRVWLYRGDGAGLWLTWAPVVSAASDVVSIITPGDWDGDGYPDMIVRASSGQVRLYRGDGVGGFAPPTPLAADWTSVTAAFSPGDFDGDDAPDVLARTSTGTLLLYRGDGAGGLGAGVVVGTGWNTMSAIFSPGDWNGDGNSDVLARDTSGRLLLYPGDGAGGWGATRQVGSGWNIMTAVFSPHDWDGDGRADVLARNTAGDLLLYPGDGTGGWGTSRRVGTGWAGMAAFG